MPDTNKIKTYEFFSTKYSVIIQAENFAEATKQFSERYNDAKIILAIDTEYFKLMNKVIELEVKG